MSKLVIVESPAKAKTIKKYLGSGYEVTASMGHVRDLPANRLSVDVANDFAPKYSVIKDKEEVVKKLKKAAGKSETVYLATDPDREGEAISWHIATILGLDLNQANRVTFNEITKTGIKNGMDNLRAIDLKLVDAQQARRILDRLVGYKLSPFVSQKIRRGLSAGRVQSVAVRLIVDREDEINAFKPEEYWSLDAKLLSSRKSFSASFYGDEKGKVKLTSKEQTDGYIARLEGAQYVVKSVKKGVRKKQPAPPFITSTLQQDASRALGFQSKRTMKTAQELYEGVDIKGIGSMGLITYMRTDSLRISEEARSSGNAFIAENYGRDYLPDKPRIYKSRANSQDGHEAIRPSDPSLTPERVKSSLNADQYKLYNLIWKRFMASLMANCVQNTVKAEIEANGCIFTASGYSVQFDGYTVLYEALTDEENEDDGKLPELKSGDGLKLRELCGNQHFTQPPPRFTEASLIKTLEEIGVGRPSTYASIISTIASREYVKREGKQLRPTELGQTITGLLKERFPKIVNAEFTAKMETSLDEIGAGREDYVRMLREFYDDFDETLLKAKEDMQGVKITLKEDETDIICEKCGRNMVVKTGKFGKFLACPGYPECKNTRPLVVETGALCPKCGGNVVQKKTPKGYVFYGCGNYPQCEFMTWDEPVKNEKCPSCGKSLFRKRGGIIACLAEGCDYEHKIERRKKSSEV